MIGDLKPYPVMKDSGAQWLGAVPEHWDVLPNRAVFTEVKEREHPKASAHLCEPLEAAGGQGCTAACSCSTKFSCHDALRSPFDSGAETSRHCCKRYPAFVFRLETLLSR